MTIEIVDFPIEHGGSFHSFLYVYQRVCILGDVNINQQNDHVFWLFMDSSNSHELQPKFGLMESSIRSVSIFWKLSWGLENDNTLFKKR